MAENEQVNNRVEGEYINFSITFYLFNNNNLTTK